MKQTTGPNNKRGIFVAAVAVLLLICAVLIMAWLLTRPTYVFSVNGIKVEREELVYAMVEHRLAVASDVETRYGVDSGDADFWEREFNGETPNEMLRSTAAQAIVVDKVQQLAAKQQGVDVMLSYSLLENARQRENKDRISSNGDVFYGPDELSFHMFYVNYLMGIQNKLKEALRPTVLAVSEEQIQSYYEGHRDDYITESGDYQEMDAVRDLIQNVLENERYDVYVQELVSHVTIEYFDAYHTVTEADSLI